MDKLSWGGAFALRKHVINVRWEHPDGMTGEEAIVARRRGQEVDENGVFVVTFGGPTHSKHGAGTYRYPATLDDYEAWLEGNLDPEFFYRF